MMTTAERKEAIQHIKSLTKATIGRSRSLRLNRLVGQSYRAWKNFTLVATMTEMEKSTAQWHGETGHVPRRCS